MNMSVDTHSNSSSSDDQDETLTSDHTSLVDAPDMNLEVDTPIKRKPRRRRQCLIMSPHAKKRKAFVMAHIMSVVIVTLCNYY